MTNRPNYFSFADSLSGLQNAIPATGDLEPSANDSFTVKHGCLTVSRPDGRPVIGQSRLGAKEVEILGSLYCLRLLTTKHIERLHFLTGPAGSRKRLTQLYLARLRQLELVVQLGQVATQSRRGRGSFIYGLSGRGMAALGPPSLVGQRRRRVWAGKPYFQDHMLSCSETYVRLVETCRNGPATLLEYAPESGCWRRFAGPGGEPVLLRPDGYCRVGIGDFALTSFIEVDLGSESLPTVSRKCELYIKYCQTGIEQQLRRTFPQVVWLVPSERRGDGIKSVIRRLSSEWQRLFSVALAADGPRVLTTLPSQVPGRGAAR